MYIKIGVKLACKLANNTHANMAENKSVRQNTLLLNNHIVLACRIPLAKILYYPIAEIVVISGGKQEIHHHD